MLIAATIAKLDQKNNYLSCAFLYLNEASTDTNNGLFVSKPLSLTV